MKTWTHRLALLVLGVLGIGTLFGAGTAEPIPPGLKAGDTLLFLGDSITHQCLYTRYVTLFYMTRYPSTPLHFYNSGVGGDKAADALRRFEYDVAALKPACVTVLLGMNDGRYRPLGEPQFSRYKTDMTKLADRLQKETSAKIFLLTPTMYDYHGAVLRRGRGIQGYNDALIAFGGFLQKLGAERNLPVVDMNSPLVKATAALRKKTPDVTVIPGGVHPNAAGHLVMAYTILKAFGVTPVVSTLTVDTRARKSRTVRAELENLNIATGSVDFDVRAAALPFPYRSDARMVLAVLPFTRELNREILTIKGLAPGRYRVDIDGNTVGAWTAAALGAGINLADNEKTPQHRQALDVMALNDQRTEIMRRIRNFRLNEKRKGYPNPDGSYPRMLKKRVRGKDGKIRWVDDPAGERRFLENRKKLPEWLKQIRALEAECYRAAQPKPHHYSIRRLD